MSLQTMSFDNDGKIVVTNREYRRRKIQIGIDNKNKPTAKVRKKKTKTNYLKKRKK